MTNKKGRHAWFFFFLAGFLLFFLTNCTRESSPKNSSPFNLTGPQKNIKIILKVKNSSYSNSDFEKYIRTIVGKNPEALTIPSLSRLYDKFVEEKILLQGARDRRITLTQQEKKEYLVKVSNGFWPSGEKESAKESSDQNMFDKLLIEKYIYQLVKDIAVEEEEINEYYELHKREFLQPERIKVSQILLETEEKAREVLERVKTSSEEDFRKIAMAESIGPEAPRGGEMGVFKVGELPFEIEKVVLSLKEGEISSIVASSYGYHIFKLDKKYEPELVSKGEASPSIKTKILDLKIKQFLSSHLDELKESMKWESYPQNLFFPYERNIS